MLKQLVRTQRDGSLHLSTRTTVSHRTLPQRTAGSVRKGMGTWEEFPTQSPCQQPSPALHSAIRLICRKLQLIMSISPSYLFSRISDTFSTKSSRTQYTKSFTICPQLLHHSGLQSCQSSPIPKHKVFSDMFIFWHVIFFWNNATPPIWQTSFWSPSSKATPSGKPSSSQSKLPFGNPTALSVVNLSTGVFQIAG